MDYFGKSWGAPICENKAPTPVGQPCYHCEEVIQEGDRGLLLSGSEPLIQPVHLECFLRTVVGSLGHLRHTCSCYGGNEEDPPGMTKREAAIAAVREYEKIEHFRIQTF